MDVFFSGRTPFNRYKYAAMMVGGDDVLRWEDVIPVGYDLARVTDKSVQAAKPARQRLPTPQPHTQPEPAHPAERELWWWGAGTQVEDGEGVSTPCACVEFRPIRKTTARGDTYTCAQCRREPPLWWLAAWEVALTECAETNARLDA